MKQKKNKTKPKTPTKPKVPRQLRGIQSTALNSTALSRKDA